MTDGPDPDARLQRLLGGDALAALRGRLRRRYETAPDDGAIGRFRISGLSEDEHAALAALLGRPPRAAGSLAVDVAALDAALQQSGIARSLHHALEQLDGPIVHRATARRALEAAWSDVVGGCGHADLVTWLRTPSGLGLLKRLAGSDPATARGQIRRAEAVLRRLPANGVPRSQLAADALGDAHGLDNGQPVATLVLAVWRTIAAPVRDDEEDGATASTDPPQTASDERARDIWARAGVLVNELARPVLFLNLPVIGGHAATPGEPAYASLRALLRSPPAWDVAGRIVFVCENPNLVAIAADRLGTDCAPLVCTDGAPAAAQRCLLAQLVRSGAVLRYHGDFDWPGIQIGNQLMRDHGAQPWRFGAADYRAAIGTASGLGQTLAGRVVEAGWDAALSPAMQEHRIAVAEEALAAVLVPDLDMRPGQPGVPG